MADNWCSSSLALPHQLKDVDRPARLPLDDRVFLALTPDQPASVLQSHEMPGLWAHMVTLVGSPPNAEMYFCTQRSASRSTQ